MQAEVQEGYLYELSRGIITVSDVPNRRHMLDRRRDQRHLLQAYKASASRVESRSSPAGSECKLLIERPRIRTSSRPLALPDAATEIEDEKLLATMGPRDRDRGRFARARESETTRKNRKNTCGRRQGILDRRSPTSRVMVVMRRSRGRWVETTVRPPAIYRTRLLPGSSSRSRPFSRRPG